MFRFALIAAILLILPQEQEAKPRESKPPIPLKELQERGVTGNLGIPLGNSVSIQVEIVDGAELGPKSVSRLFLLKVTHIDGKKIDKPRNFPFHVFPLTFDSEKLFLACNYNQLNDMFDSRDVPQKGRTAFKNRYVGSTLRLAAYETGDFSGIPNKLPEGMHAWPGTGFNFRSYLVVLKSLK